MDVFNLGQDMMENPGDYDPWPVHLACQAYRDFRNNGSCGDRFAHGAKIDDVQIPPEQQRTRITNDDNYVVRSWIAVVTYLLSDYRFIYQ